MPATPSHSSAVARHVEAAKRLLRELEQHAGTAIDAIGREDGSEFLAAVTERDRILAQLDQVVEALSHSRPAPNANGEHDPEIANLFSEMAAAAAAALESHDQLASFTRSERDRLAAAMQRSNSPDVVAHQYSAVANAGRPRTLSVTG
jgi:hypothetical protein